MTGEGDRAQLGRTGTNYYAEAIAAALKQRQDSLHLKTIVKADEMVWEESPQGKLKHMVNEGMGTKEYCLDMYQQVLGPWEKSGRHRHLSEELLYVLEGSGYDLHWDPKFEAHDVYEWSWEDTPKRFDWSVGDFVLIPPYSAHQHFENAGGTARLISATSRIHKAMGMDWLEQLETCGRWK